MTRLFKACQILGSLHILPGIWCPVVCAKPCSIYRNQNASQLFETISLEMALLAMCSQLNLLISNDLTQFVCVDFFLDQPTEHTTSCFKWLFMSARMALKRHIFDRNFFVQEGEHPHHTLKT